ncbi:Repressor of filamentous growth 1 [Hypsizygus marmoreus]|uniref:Repressor of filamentous growth 1 n=1 Tax=Hypsizygus marmoreus TaxID=39966 RepID=A0A369JZ87_HYPMA|nr:Repressor of filamentous growth 1 [Hypsizygus marmoreus]
MPALRTRDTQSRSLEVTTDAPQPPTLAIISPTPRAFTFPTTHNLSDSPFSSPSHSPFEPDLRTLALSSCTTPPNFMRTLTPDTPLTSVSPSPSSHKRRKSSSCSSDVERRPKKGDEDYIKRPENAFILFRRKCCEDRQAAQEEAASDGPTKKQRQADLSKTISQQWKGLSAGEKQYWEQLAKEKKKEHEQMYPNYVYRPQRAKDKDGRSKSRKPKGRRGDLEETDSESVSFVLPVVQHHRHHGRSASAPTPPPYQSIQIPNVYQMTPSCPTSPSLLPMISRRSSHPDHPEDPMASFDFHPNDNFMPPSFGQAGQFEASLQPSQFLRDMFTISGMTHRDSLHPLEVSQEHMLLPPHQVISPSSSSAVDSSSSGPSSPSSGPFTPRSALLSSSFARLDTSCESEQPQNQAELDLQMEMQLQAEYASYSWETNTMWPTNTELLLGDNDFDLGMIPPIDLGVPKYHESSMPAGGPTEMDQYAQEYTQEYSQEYSEGYGQTQQAAYAQEDGHNLDGVLAFEEMMAEHGF